MVFSSSPPNRKLGMVSQLSSSTRGCRSGGKERPPGRRPPIDTKTRRSVCPPRRAVRRSPVSSPPPPLTGHVREWRRRKPLFDFIYSFFNAIERRRRIVFPKRPREPTATNADEYVQRYYCWNGVCQTPDNEPRHAVAASLLFFPPVPHNRFMPRLPYTPEVPGGVGRMIGRNVSRNHQVVGGLWSIDCAVDTR